MLKFDKLNEYYDDLVGDGDFENDVITFISNYFKNRSEQHETKDLQFAIIETTLRNEVQHLGHTFIYGGKWPDKTAILEAYQETILNLAKETSLNPADTDEWYERDYSYILIDKNSNPTKAIDRPVWHTGLDNTTKEKEIKEPPTYKLEDSHFEEYLNEYAKRIFNNLKLDEYPHYCLIVKPITLKRKNQLSFLGIGNLYLLFCTTHPHDKHFYGDLINKLILVWLNTYWQILLSDLQNVKIGDDHYYPKMKADQLKDFKKVKISEGKTASEWFDRYFFNEKNRKELKNAFSEILFNVYKYFPKAVHTDPKSRKDMPPDIENQLKGGGRSALREEDLIEAMVKMTYVRMLGVVAMHVFGMKIRELHSWLENGSPIASTVANRTVYIFFRSRWMSLRSDTKLHIHDYMKESLLYCLSPFEIAMLIEELNLLVSKLEPTDEYLAKVKELIICLGELD